MILSSIMLQRRRAVAAANLRVTKPRFTRQRISLPPTNSASSCGRSEALSPWSEMEIGAGEPSTSPDAPYLRIGRSPAFKSTEKCFDLLLTRLCSGDAKLSSNSRFSLASRRRRHDDVIWDARRGGHLYIFPGARERSASSMFLCTAPDTAAPSSGTAAAVCRLAAPSPEEIIECASIAAYDFPVLLGPMKIVRGRSESDARLIGPKFLIAMSKCRGAMSSCAGSAAGMGASKCCAGRLPACAFRFPPRLFTAAGVFWPLYTRRAGQQGINPLGCRGWCAGPERVGQADLEAGAAAAKRSFRR